MYIGSTTESLKKILERHRKDFKEYCQQKERRYSSAILLFEEFGVENCQILLLANYPCSSREELEAEEGEYQKNNQCINKNLAGRKQLQYYMDNKDKLKEQAKEYCKKNKEHINERNKNWNEQHKEEMKEYKQQWYAKNKEHHQKKCKEYRQNHSEEVLQKSREWYEHNKYKQNERKKENYQRNKEQILEKAKVKTTCSCGSVLCNQHLRRHERSKKHQDWRKQQQE